MYRCIGQLQPSTRGHSHIKHRLRGPQAQRRTWHVAQHWRETHVMQTYTEGAVGICIYAPRDREGVVLDCRVFKSLPAIACDAVRSVQEPRAHRVRARGVRAIADRLRAYDPCRYSIFGAIGRRLTASRRARFGTGRSRAPGPVNFAANGRNPVAEGDQRAPGILREARECLPVRSKHHRCDREQRCPI